MVRSLPGPPGAGAELLTLLLPERDDLGDVRDFQRFVIDKLAEALNKGLNEAIVQKRLADLGAEIAEPNRRGPKALGDLVKSEVARLTPILKAATAK